MNLKNKKILVTGGCGFIGSHLVQKLVKKGAKVTVLDNLSTGRIENLNLVKTKVKIIKFDLSIQKSFKLINKNYEYVFHLAALADIVPSIKDPQKYFQSNVIGTENLLNFFKDSKIKKFIYTASSSCYGIPKIYPTPEDYENNPQYPYAFTKLVGEQIIQHYSKIYGVPYMSMRLFNVYGTRSRTSGTYGAVFGVFLAQKIANKPLTVVGNGKQKRDFTYVTDVAEALIKAATSKRKNIVLNVGSGKSISVNKIVKLLKSEHVNIPKRPGEPFQTFADISKIQKLLHWKPQVDITLGVKLLLENIDYWNKAPLWTPKKINKETKLWFKFLK